MENNRNPLIFISVWTLLCFLLLAIDPIYEIASIGKLLEIRFLFLAALSVFIEIIYYFPVILCSGIAFCNDRKGILALAIYAVLQILMVEYRFLGFDGLNSRGVSIVSNGQVTTIAHIYFSFFSLGPLLVTQHLANYHISRHQNKDR